MIFKYKKHHLYLFIAVNLLPLVGVPLELWTLKVPMYLYWGECALVAAFAAAMYAKHLIVFFVILSAIGFIVYLANPHLLEDMNSIVIFWSLYGLCWLIYVEIGKSPYGQALRKLRSSKQLTLYLVFMSLFIGLCLLLTVTVSDGWRAVPHSSAFYQTFISVAIIVPTISIGMVRVIDMIGEKHFIDFVFGTYHQPRVKDSIVLFLDMVGSSAMAEKLEPERSLKLIAQFIYDSGYIFRTHGGDILNYTGDGLVVLWPRNQANSALSSVRALRAHFASQIIRKNYWKKFGLVPDFRIGIHSGPVVIGQIGEEKLFLGLYGDVVNTAARLEQMNKTLGTSVLLSAEVTQGLSQAWKALLKPMGEKEVRGRHEKISVYTIYKD